MSSLVNETARLTFIGAGNMASSIIGGLVSNGYEPDLICAADPSTTQLEKLAEEFGIHTGTENQSAIEQAEVIILAVKPQVMEQVISPLQATLQNKRPLLISIAAGITIDNLLSWGGDDLPIIRTMPNTPALVQCGATGLHANDRVNAAQKQIAHRIFEAVGLALWFDQEEELDQVVAVSGSGPAYYFMVMEAMEKAGVNLGMAPEIARQLTLQTALGAAKLALASDVEPAELRRRVTSPGGTTEQAIKRFEEGGLVDLFDQAIKAAMERSRELTG